MEGGYPREWNSFPLSSAFLTSALLMPFLTPLPSWISQSIASIGLSAFDSCIPFPLLVSTRVRNGRTIDFQTKLEDWIVRCRRHRQNLDVS